MSKFIKKQQYNSIDENIYDEFVDIDSITIEEIDKEIEDFYIDKEKINNIKFEFDKNLIIKEAIDKAEEDIKKEKNKKIISKLAACIALLLSIGIYNPALAYNIPPIMNVLENINNLLHVDEIASYIGVDKIIPRAVVDDENKVKFVKPTKYKVENDNTEIIGLGNELENSEKVLEISEINTQYGVVDFIHRMSNKIINPIDGRIHSSFNQTITTTGRISSTEPNLQNIPVKLEMGRNIRKVFISDKGCKLVDADYSQVELRVLAHMSQDETMIDAFKHNEDIHTKTASQVFNVSMDEVTSKQRSDAKAVNFGIVYGKSDFGLSEDLNIPVKQAKEYIENYFNKYNKIKEFMDNIIDDASSNGYVTTILNRRRYIPEIKSSNFMLRNAGKRAAMNAPIQGSAADIIKIAMINVYKKLEENNLKSKLILQVHDELIVEAVDSEIDIVKKIVKDEMENAVCLDVNLDVDLNIGDSWYDTK